MDIRVKVVSDYGDATFEEALLYWIKHYEKYGYRVEVHYGITLNHDRALLIARKETEDETR
jgi:hypothetical protein